MLFLNVVNQSRNEPVQSGRGFYTKTASTEEGGSKEKRLNIV